jgi:nitrite reductase (NO-forming)
MLFIPIAMLILTACTSQSSTVARADTARTAPSVTVEFSLRAALMNRRIVYIGSGGDLEGAINPDLVVQPGDVVRVILTNTDGMSHDWFQPELGVRTPPVMKIGESAETVFEVSDVPPGVYAYYCTSPGHRQAGQEGKLIVAGSAP